MTQKKSETEHKLNNQHNTCWKTIQNTSWTIKITHAEKADESGAYDDHDHNAHTPEEAEKEARESTETTLDEFFDFVSDLERKDWFEQYINTIVDEFDPHTYYFGPEDKERFDVSISGKLEGIGARLQKKNDFTEIYILETVNSATD